VISDGITEIIVTVTVQSITENLRLLETCVLLSIFVSFINISSLLEKTGELDEKRLIS
jgi:hypothetical protein